jgi:small-conductance mechanosensitive channel
MLTEPEDDPRLENVRDKLATLRRQIDDAEWHDKPVTNAQRQMAKRLTNLLHNGILWEPTF